MCGMHSQRSPLSSRAESMHFEMFSLGTRLARAQGKISGESGQSDIRLPLMALKDALESPF